MSREAYKEIFSEQHLTRQPPPQKSRIYLCQEKDCDKSYSRQGHLSDHIIVAHTRKFLYNCSSCRRGFLRPGKLNIHKCNPDVGNDLKTGDTKDEMSPGLKQTSKKKNLKRKSRVLMMSDVEEQEMTGNSGLFSCSACQFSTNIGSAFTNHLTSIKHNKNVNPDAHKQADELEEEPEVVKFEKEKNVPTAADTIISRSGRKIIPKKFSDEFAVDNYKSKLDLTLDCSHNKFGTGSPVKSPSKPATVKSNFKSSPTKDFSAPCRICSMKFKNNTR